MAAVSPAWIEKLFTKDRLSREAFTLLAPEFHAKDLASHESSFFGPKIAELGKRLYGEGSLPGLSSWESEESPEFVLSIDLWEQALEEESSMPFNSLVQACYLQAEAAYGQMGNLAPRLAALRWCCCMCWLAARSNALDAASAGGCFGSISKETSLEACKEAKMSIIGWLNLIVKTPAIMAIYDFDLVGHGVWHSGGREPIMRQAYNEWFRRGCEYDIIKLCMQVLELPPENLNASVPLLKLVQPLGSVDLYLPLHEIPRRVIDQHNWFADVRASSLDELPAKAHIPGFVLDVDIPPEPVFDFEDPEIIAKVQRGEDLGKAEQEDGLPGAVHGSIGLLFAAMCAAEKIEHIHFSNDMLKLEGFVEYLLKYGPPLRTLDLSGCAGSVNEDLLKLLALAGSSVTVLDLSDCDLVGDCIDALLEALVALPGIKHLDLAGNQLDQEAAIYLVAELAERRLDVASVRLDGNPTGEASILRDTTAISLAKRGASTVAGGELVLSFGDNAVRWTPTPVDGQPLERIRDGGKEPLRLTSLKDLRQSVTAQKRRLEEFEETDPAAQTEEGQKWLQQQRSMVESVLNSEMMQIYRRELAARAKPTETAAAVNAGGGGQ